MNHKMLAQAQILVNIAERNREHDKKSYEGYVSALWQSIAHQQYLVQQRSCMLKPGERTSALAEAEAKEEATNKRLEELRDEYERNHDEHGYRKEDVDKIWST